MAISKLIPAKRELRERIFITDESNHKTISSDDNGKDFLLSDDVVVLFYPVPESLVCHVPALTDALNKNLLKPGNCLILDNSSGDEIYYLLDDFVNSSPEAKARNIISVCQALGVKSCEISLNQQIEEKRSKSTDFSVGGDSHIGSAGLQAGVSSESVTKNLTKIFSHAKFKGGEPNIERAASLIRERGLGDELGVRALFDAVRDRNNLIDHFEWQVDFSRDIKNKAGFFLKAKAKNKIAGINSSLEVDSESLLNEKIYFKFKVLL